MPANLAGMLRSLLKARQTASETELRFLTEIARSLGTASGGQVTLANRTGGGAVARFDLPAAQLPVAEAEEVPA